MKFSNIILTTTLSILLLDTGFVLGKKPRKGRGKGPGKRGKLIENQCEALDLEDEEVDKKECMQTLNCDVENKVCINFVPTACDEITDPTKEDCRKNGCLFVKDTGTCEVDPCIAACVEEEDNNPCCLRRCHTVDKCSKANSKQGKCEKKKKNKEECVYDSETDVCSRAVEGCYAFNGQETACDDAEEGCVYDACTEQCSKE